MIYELSIRPETFGLVLAFKPGNVDIDDALVVGFWDHDIPLRRWYAKVSPEHRDAFHTAFPWVSLD